MGAQPKSPKPSDEFIIGPQPPRGGLSALTVVGVIVMCLGIGGVLNAWAHVDANADDFYGPYWGVGLGLFGIAVGFVLSLVGAIRTFVLTSRVRRNTTTYRTIAVAPPVSLIVLALVLAHFANDAISAYCAIHGCQATLL